MRTGHDGGSWPDKGKAGRGITHLHKPPMGGAEDQAAALGRPQGLASTAVPGGRAVNVAPQSRSQARSIARAGDTSSLRSEPLSGRVLA